MKIGLVSPYNSQNYGTVLQAFALAYVLRSKGVDCEYINYSVWERGSKAQYFRFLIKHPLYIISKKWTQHLNRNDLKYSHVRDRWFAEVVRKNNEFVNDYIPVSSRTYTYDTLRELQKSYSKYIIGSDQTWSPFHELFYSMFFLNYNKYGKAYSYAPSLGTTLPSGFFIKFLSRKVKKMSLASCREVCNSKKLSLILNKCVKCVLDPTLLISKQEWVPYMIKVESIEGEYVLCYILGERLDISETAEMLGKNLSLPVYYITTRDIYRTKAYTLEDVGVGEFLWLINNARFVITDSFHCTIFSINFNRDFYCFDKMPGASYDNGRLSDMLKQVGLQDRLLNETCEVVSYINYTVANQILDAKREDSLGFIDKILED